MRGHAGRAGSAPYRCRPRCPEPRRAPPLPQQPGRRPQQQQRGHGSPGPAPPLRPALPSARNGKRGRARPLAMAAPGPGGGEAVLELPEAERLFLREHPLLSPAGPGKVRPCGGCEGGGHPEGAEGMGPPPCGAGTAWDPMESLAQRWKAEEGWGAEPWCALPSPALGWIREGY